MRTLKLINNTQYNITRSVQDMAALFAYSLAEDSKLTMIVELDKKVLTIKFLEAKCILWQKNLYVIDLFSGEINRLLKLQTIYFFSKLTGYMAELPWGILTGVRPGKLVHKLAEQNIDLENIPEYLNEKYLLPLSKGNLLRDICKVQQKVIQDKSETGIYIGIPFCPSKCTYCSFPSGIIPKSEDEQENFLNFIEQDIINVVKLISMHGLNITSLYIGGGTPTSFNDNIFAKFMKLVEKYLAYATIKEFTVEAGRPDCFSINKLKTMEYVGVNRISVNPQTLNDKTLKIIGRNHSVADFYRAYELVAQSEIKVINTDLIIGLPGETAEDILHTFSGIKSLRPDNITVHTLTLKKSAKLFGSTYNLEANVAEKLVEDSAVMAQTIGMHPYYLYRQHYMLGQLANIGYAKPGTESIYNIQMMEERHKIIGIGPSSATKVPLSDGHHLNKLNMPKNIFTYTEKLDQLAAKRAQLFENKEV